MKKRNKRKDMFQKGNPWLKKAVKNLNLMILTRINSSTLESLASMDKVAGT